MTPDQPLKLTKEQRMLTQAWRQQHGSIWCGDRIVAYVGYESVAQQIVDIHNREIGYENRV